MAEAAPYPVTFDAAYPERLSRLSTFFRLLLAIPVLIFWAVIGGINAVLPAWLAILVRGRIPRWLFDFQVALNRWSNRAVGYLLLLTDRYPPFEGDGSSATTCATRSACPAGSCSSGRSSPPYPTS